MPTSKPKQLSNTATWFNSKSGEVQQKIINDIFSLGRELERYVAICLIMPREIKGSLDEEIFKQAVAQECRGLKDVYSKELSLKTAGVVTNFHQDKRRKWIVTLEGGEHVGKERDKYMSKSMGDLKKTLHTALSSDVTWDYLQSHNKEGKKISGKTVNGLWWCLDAKSEFVALMECLSKVPKIAPVLAVALDPGLEHLKQAIKELCEREGVRVKGQSLASSVTIVDNPLYASGEGGGERAGAGASSSEYYLTNEDMANAAKRQPVGGVSNPMYAALSLVGGFDGAVGRVVSQGAAAGSDAPLLPPVASLAVREHLLASMQEQGYEAEDASALYSTIGGDLDSSDEVGHLRLAVTTLRTNEEALASLNISDISTNVDRCLACLMAVIVEDRYKHLKITQANILKALTDEENTLFMYMAPFYGIEEWTPSFAQLQSHWIGRHGDEITKEDFHDFLVQCLQAIDPNINADSFAGGPMYVPVVADDRRLAVNDTYDGAAAEYGVPLEQGDGDAAIAKALVIQMIDFAKVNNILITECDPDQGDAEDEVYEPVARNLRDSHDETNLTILANYQVMSQGSIPAEGFSATVMARMVKFNNDLTMVLAGLLVGTSYEAHNQNIVQVVTYANAGSDGSEHMGEGSSAEEDGDGLLGGAQDSGSASLRTADATYSAATIDLPEEQENVAKMLAELSKQEDTTLSLVGIRAMHQQCADAIERLGSEEESDEFTLAEQKQTENTALLQEHDASMLVNGILQFAQDNSHVIRSTGGVELSADNQESKGKMLSNYREKFPSDEELTEIAVNIADVAVVGELLNDTGFSVAPPPRPARPEQPLVVDEDGHDSDTGTIAIDTSVDSALALAQQIEGSQNELSLVIPDAKPNEDRDTYSRVEALHNGHNGLDQTIKELAAIIKRVENIHRRALQAPGESESLTSLPQKLEDIRAKQAENAALLHGRDELMMAEVPGSGAAVIGTDASSGKTASADGSDSTWMLTHCFGLAEFVEQIGFDQDQLSGLPYEAALELHVEVGERIGNLMEMVAKQAENQVFPNEKIVAIGEKQAENQALLDVVAEMLVELASTSKEVEALVVKLESTHPGEQQVAVPEHAMNMAEVPIVEVKKGLDAMKRIKKALERLVMGLEAETCSAVGDFSGMLDGRTMAPVGDSNGYLDVEYGTEVNANGANAGTHGGAMSNPTHGDVNSAGSESDNDFAEFCSSVLDDSAAAGLKAEEVVKPNSGGDRDVAAGGLVTPTKLERLEISDIIAEGQTLKRLLEENKGVSISDGISEEIMMFAAKVADFKQGASDKTRIGELDGLIKAINELKAGTVIEQGQGALSPGRKKAGIAEPAEDAADGSFSQVHSFFQKAATAGASANDLYAEPAVNNNPVYHVVSLDSNQEGAGTGLFESPSSTNSGSDVANDDEEDTYNQVTLFAGGARMVGKTALHVVEVDPDCDPNATQLNPTQPREDYELDGEGVAKEATGFGNVSL